MLVCCYEDCPYIYTEVFKKTLSSLSLFSVLSSYNQGLGLRHSEIQVHTWMDRFLGARMDGLAAIANSLGRA